MRTFFIVLKSFLAKKHNLSETVRKRTRFNMLLPLFLFQCNQHDFWIILFSHQIYSTARVYIFHILSPILLWIKYVFYRFGICYLVVPLFDLWCCYDDIFISGICPVCVAKFNCQMWKSLSPISCGKLHSNTCISLWLMFEIEYKYFFNQI